MNKQNEKRRNQNGKATFNGSEKETISLARCAMVREKQIALGWMGWTK